MSHTSSIKTDFLKPDAQIPGQNYFLVSFVDPPNRRLEDRVRYECYKYMSQMLQSDEQVVNLMTRLGEASTPFDRIKMIQDDYLGWLAINGVDVRKEFATDFGDEVALRAIKIRGVFSSTEDAHRKVKELQKSDPNFHIYLGDCGKWMPSFPDSDTVHREMAAKYQDEDLNNLIEENMIAQEQGKVQFQERQREMKENPETAEAIKKRKVTSAQRLTKFRELHRRAKSSKK
jgi:hypothetical protein